MILITRCPGCYAVFRLTAVQLHTRDGKVRCGQCLQVFDGFRALMAVPESYIQPIIPSAQPCQHQPRSLPLAAEPVETTLHPFDRFERSPVQNLSRFWLVLNLLLLVLLLGQIAHVYRTEISVALPATRPILDKYCVLMRCEVGFPRYLNLLSLESSDLYLNASSGSEVMTLLAIVRNHAPFPQELPALLLTLTDGDERPLASRIFTAEDYIDSKQKQTIFEANSELPLQCYLDTGEIDARGYKLELIYP